MLLCNLRYLRRLTSLDSVLLQQFSTCWKSNFYIINSLAKKVYYGNFLEYLLIKLIFILKIFLRFIFSLNYSFGSTVFVSFQKYLPENSSLIFFIQSFIKTIYLQSLFKNKIKSTRHRVNMKCCLSLVGKVFRAITSPKKNNVKKKRNKFAGNLPMNSITNFVA